MMYSTIYGKLNVVFHRFILFSLVYSCNDLSVKFDFIFSVKQPQRAISVVSLHTLRRCSIYFLDNLKRRKILCCYEFFWIISSSILMFYSYGKAEEKSKNESTICIHKLNFAMIRRTSSKRTELSSSMFNNILKSV